jgi:hypothetical protein
LDAPIDETYTLLDLAMLAIPFLVAAIAQRDWPGRTKELLCLLVCLAGGGLVVYADGGDLLDVAATAPLLFFAAQGLYLKFLKPRGIAPWFERVTTLLTPFAKARLAAKPAPAAPAAPAAPPAPAPARVGQKIVITKEQARALTAGIDPDFARVLDELGADTQGVPGGEGR